MKIRRIIFFATPVVLATLTLLTVTFWILEIKAHSSFTDAACPFFAGLLFFAFPLLVSAAWFSGRKVEATVLQKIFVWTPIAIMAVPWTFLCMAFIGLMGWKGD